MVYQCTGTRIRRRERNTWCYSTHIISSLTMYALVMCGFLSADMMTGSLMRVPVHYVLRGLTMYALVMCGLRRADMMTGSLIIFITIAGCPITAITAG